MKNNIQNKILTYSEIKNTIFKDLNINLKNVNATYLIDKLNNVRYNFCKGNNFPDTDWGIFMINCRDKIVNKKWDELKIIKERWIDYLDIIDGGLELDIRDWRKNIKFLIKHRLKNEKIYSLVISVIWFENSFKDIEAIKLGPHILLTNEINVDNLINYIEDQINSSRLNQECPEIDKLVVSFRYYEINFTPVKWIGNKKIYLNNSNDLYRKSLINWNRYNILKIYDNIFLQDKFSIDLINILDELYEKYDFRQYKLYFLVKPDFNNFKYDVLKIDKRLSNYSSWNASDLSSDFTRIIFLYKKYGFLYSCSINRWSEGFSVSSCGYLTINIHNIIEKRKMAKFILKGITSNINLIDEDLDQLNSYSEKHINKFDKVDRKKEIMLIINAKNSYS